MSGPINVHGTALRLRGRGILLRGPSGSGKSSLALSVLRRAEAAGVDAALVADDQVFLTRDGDRLRAHAPAALVGLIELRGIGILPERHVPETFVELVVDLVPRGEVERMPPATAWIEIAGMNVRAVRLAERDPAFGADVLLTLAAAAPFWNPDERA